MPAVTESIAKNLSVLQESLAPGERDSYDEQLGAANRALNEIVGDGFGPLTGPYGPSWRSVFAGMLEDVLSDGGRVRVRCGSDR